MLPFPLYYYRHIVPCRVNLMKKPQQGSNWLFVDESGDPTFYNRKGDLIVGNPGCSRILILGFIETQDPSTLRRNLLILHHNIVNDLRFANIPSMKKTKVAFHAKDDFPEIRHQVFELLATLDFKAQFVVARKIEPTFRKRYRGNKNTFYDSLVTQLFQNVLHRYQQNHVYFAKRGSRNRQVPLTKAIEKSVAGFESKWGTTVSTTTKVQAQISSAEPCLSIVDYMNWAVYRAFVRQEMVPFEIVREKVSLLVDLYDSGNYPNNWYNRHKNPFDISKISPL